MSAARGRTPMKTRGRAKTAAVMALGVIKFAMWILKGRGADGRGFAETLWLDAG